MKASVRKILRMEHLEDRLTPTAVLSDLENIAASRILVSLDQASDSNAIQVLSKTDLSTSIKPLGFGIYSVDLNPQANLQSAINFYSQLPGVQSAEPDRVITVSRTPNDPQYSSQWGLPKIGAPAAWDRTTTTRTNGIVVAVIDTGVDVVHPDLAANIWTNSGEIANNGIDDDGNGFVDDMNGWDFANNDSNPADDNSHGTHVAGIIGATGNNSVGISGVAWSTRIMALKFLGANGSGLTSHAVSSLNYAVENGAKIVNASWGGGGADSTLSTAISRAQQAGVIFVAAAGNAGANNDTGSFFPANYIRSYDNMVTVAATDSNDNLASFSNRGAQTVTLGAPGVGILSTVPGGGYASYSGTSMAAPFVSGALAMLWDQNPNMTYRQVIDRLRSTVTPLASLAGKTITGGRLNLDALLTPIASPPVSPPPVSPPPASPPPPPADTQGARVTLASFAGSQVNTYNRVRVTFNEAIDASTFTTADVVLIGGGNRILTPTSVTAVSGSTTQFDVNFAEQTAPGVYSLTLLPDIRDLAGNQMDQNQNKINGENPGDRFTVQGTIAAPTTTVFRAVTAVGVPNFSTVNVRFNITQNISITDINFQLNLTHFNVGDMRVQLTSPSGQAVTLVNQRGGSGDNFSNTIFDDQASQSIASVPAPFAGIFRPEQSMAGFNGTNVRGTWTLTLSDLAGGFSGRLNSFSLIVTGMAASQGVRSLAFDANTDPDIVARDFGTAGTDEIKDISERSSQEFKFDPHPFLGTPVVDHGMNNKAGASFQWNNIGSVGADWFTRQSSRSATGWESIVL